MRAILQEGSPEQVGVAYSNRVMEVIIAIISVHAAIIYGKSNQDF